jgi:glycosyltransferase involved in cell wall biosynthesis
MFGYLPPPFFGPSVTYQALMRSEFPRHFDVMLVDITVARSIGEIERFRVGKLFKMFSFLLRELWLLTTHRFDFCFCPVSVNRNAFIKDALLLALARGFGVPTVLYAQGNNIPDFHDRSSPRTQRLIERTASRAAGAIVLGETLRFNFEKWLPPENIFVVPTGIEPLESVLRRAQHTDGVTVLFLSNLVREKGVFVLLEAAAKVVRQRGDVRFAFAGNWFRPEDEAAANAFVATHQLNSQVVFVGPVTGETKWQTLADADILAFPTFYYYETMGLVLLEAMQAGLPVVATRRASIPEIIEDGINGFLVEEQDPGDLADKILRLAGDAALRERMGRANREKFDRYYTHEQYGRRMIQVFETLRARQSASNRQPNSPSAMT